MLLRDAIFRVIDCEATHREVELAKVCEVAFRDVDFSGVVHGEFSALCNPGIPMPPSASAVHHLVDEHVAGAPPVESFRDLLQAEVYVAHGADYDAPVLGLEGPCICTHRLAKHLWPEIGNHSNQEVRYSLRLVVDLPVGLYPHRAMYDVIVTAAILREALPLAAARWPAATTVEALIAEIAKPCRLHRVPFKSANGVTFAEAETGLLEWIISKQAGGIDVIYSAQEALRERFQLRPSSGPVDDGDSDIPF